MLLYNEELVTYLALSLTTDSTYTCLYAGYIATTIGTALAPINAKTK